MSDLGNQIKLHPVFTQPGEASTLPRNQIPEGMLPADTAYQIVHDEAMLDGVSRLNLATFVTTYMDKEAKLLYAQTVDKNMID